MSDITFSEVEHLANGKRLALVCHYRYELRDGDGIVVFWSHYLEDIENFLRTYHA